MGNPLCQIIRLDDENIFLQMSPVLDIEAVLIFKAELDHMPHVEWLVILC